MSVIDIEAEQHVASPSGASLSNVSLPETLRIMFGSEMGNAELVADNLGDALNAANVTAECVTLNDQPVDELAGLGVALFVISTCGEGDMPYNSELFWKQLSAADAPSLEGLQYAVFAMGDSGYTYFCDAGVRLDARLAELGATRIAERTDCDVSYVDPSNQWIAERVAQLAPRTNGDTADDAAAVAAVAAKRPTGPMWNRETAFTATLQVNRLLSGEGSAKEIRHYEIDITGSDIQYHPGDSFGVIPRNSRTAVDRFLTVAGLTGEETLDHVSVRALATETWELRYPSAALLDAITANTPQGAAPQALSSGTHEAGEEWIRTHGVIETLAQLPAPLPLAELATVMGPLRYRAYSVASTPTTHPNTVHLTVATQRNSPAAALSSGVGSGFMADELAPGQEVRVFPLPNRSFRLPENPETPIIMVGPGVGAAPFRSFLLERAQAANPGSTWFFFGDQHESTDFIYADDWQALQSSGVLTRLDTAFSRDTSEKIYVQDRMREHGSELVKWLSEGAHFYVCGDGKRMAADVDRALTEIVTAELGPVAGEELITRLHTEKRYLRDVY